MIRIIHGLEPGKWLIVRTSRKLRRGVSSMVKGASKRVYSQRAQMASKRTVDESISSCETLLSRKRPLTSARLLTSSDIVRQMSSVTRFNLKRSASSEHDPSLSEGATSTTEPPGKRRRIISLALRYTMIGFLIAFFQSTLIILIYNRYRARLIKEIENRAVQQNKSPSYDQLANKIPEHELLSYRMLPLRKMSRLWGKMNEMHIPYYLRPVVYKAYAKAFGCDLEEADIPNNSLHEYHNLGQFFRRSLKPGVRPIDSPDDPSSLVSPCDGVVLSTSHIKLDSKTIHQNADGSLSVPDFRVEQIKGVTYSLRAFLQDPEAIDNLLRSRMNQDEKQCDKELFACTIYLAPGDYHRFHSPAIWSIDRRRHVAGELLSVSPSIIKYFNGVFALNERVHYFGEWKHGFLTYSPVGATNVGSIKVYFDSELQTNCPHDDKAVFEWKRREGRKQKWTPPNGEEVKKRALSSSSVEVDMEIPMEQKVIIEDFGATGVLCRSVKFNSYSNSNKSLSGNTIDSSLIQKTKDSITTAIKGAIPLRKGDPFGEFNLGSTIVLIFEAPTGSSFNIAAGQKVKVGQRLFTASGMQHAAA